MNLLSVFIIGHGELLNCGDISSMVELRTATAEDSEFIAKMILVALHIEIKGNDKFLSHMKELVEDEGTLYHWSRCIIAVSTNPVNSNRESSLIGLCLAYDGVDYHARRLRSFSFVCSDGEPVANGNSTALLEQPDESGVGEWYVDSLAVIPEYRGKGIGRLLVADAVERGKAKGLKPTILVDPDNTPAVKLYESVGFVYKEQMFVFGQIYNKMIVI